MKYRPSLSLSLSLSVQLQIKAPNRSPDHVFKRRTSFRSPSLPAAGHQFQSSLSSKYKKTPPPRRLEE